MPSKAKNRPRRQAPPPPPRKLPIPWIVGGLVGLAFVVAVAISLSGESSTATVPVEIGSPTVSGQPLPAFDRDSVDPAIGSPIPTVTGTDFDDIPITIASGEGAAGIVFLAHWCGHCQAEVPAVQQWLDGGAEPPAHLISVATSIDPLKDNYPPWSWLDREGWTTPVLVDDAVGSVMRAFGGASFPFWVFFDDDGNVVARAEGGLGEHALEGYLTLAAGL